MGLVLCQPWGATAGRVHEQQSKSLAGEADTLPQLAPIRTNASVVSIVAVVLGVCSPPQAMKEAEEKDKGA